MLRPSLLSGMLPVKRPSLLRCSSASLVYSEVQCSSITAARELPPLRPESRIPRAAGLISMLHRSNGRQYQKIFLTVLIESALIDAMGILLVQSSGSGGEIRLHFQRERQGGREHFVQSLPFPALLLRVSPHNLHLGRNGLHIEMTVLWIESGMSIRCIKQEGDPFLGCQNRSVRCFPRRYQMPPVLDGRAECGPCS